MERELVLNLKVKLPRARWLVPITVVGLAAVGYAAVPQLFTAGEPLSAAKLNDNFTALDTRGAYCGATSPLSPRLATTNGYAAGAAQCAAVSTCGASPHICTTQDMLLNASAGVAPPVGWIANPQLGYRETYVGTSEGILIMTLATANDCSGFTGTTSMFGTTWGSQGVAYYDCGSASTLPLLCCL